jgi:hypothetical protein
MNGNQPKPVHMWKDGPRRMFSTERFLGAPSRTLPRDSAVTQVRSSAIGAGDRYTKCWVALTVLIGSARPARRGMLKGPVSLHHPVP